MQYKNFLCKGLIKHNCVLILLTIIIVLKYGYNDQLFFLRHIKECKRKLKDFDKFIFLLKYIL